jgi:hypothetical protein
VTKDDTFMELRETSEFLLGNAILNRVQSPAAETLVILAES